MIGSLGVPELLFILVLALLVFGPRKLPEIGRTLGRAMGEFRRATSDLKRTLDVELSNEDLNKTPTVTKSPQSTPRQVEPVETQTDVTQPAEDPKETGDAEGASDKKEEAS